MFIYAIIIHYLGPLVYWIGSRYFALNFTYHFALLLEDVLFTKLINLAVHLDKRLGHGLDGGIDFVIGTLLRKEMFIPKDVAVDTQSDFSEISFNK